MKEKKVENLRIGDIIIIAVVVIAMLAIAWGRIKNAGAGKNGCSGNCGSCSGNACGKRR